MSEVQRRHGSLGQPQVDPSIQKLPQQRYSQSASRRRPTVLSGRHSQDERLFIVHVPSIQQSSRWWWDHVRISKKPTNPVSTSVPPKQPGATKFPASPSKPAAKKFPAPPQKPPAAKVPVPPQKPFPTKSSAPPQRPSAPPVLGSIPLQHPGATKMQPPYQQVPPIFVPPVSGSIPVQLSARLYEDAASYPASAAYFCPASFG